MFYKPDNVNKIMSYFSDILGVFPNVLRVAAVDGVEPARAAVAALDGGDLLAGGVGREGHPQSSPASPSEGGCGSRTSLCVSVLGSPLTADCWLSGLRLRSPAARPSL